MRFLPTEDDQDATASVYFHLITPDPTRPWLADNVRFATHGANVIPSVGDVIEGDFGYRSHAAQVESVESIGKGTRAFDVQLVEIPTPLQED